MAKVSRSSVFLQVLQPFPLAFTYLSQSFDRSIDRSDVFSSSGWLISVDRFAFFLSSSRTAKNQSRESVYFSIISSDQSHHDLICRIIKVCNWHIRRFFQNHAQRFFAKIRFSEYINSSRTGSRSDAEHVDLHTRTFPKEAFLNFFVRPNASSTLIHHGKDQKNLKLQTKPIGSLGIQVNHKKENVSERYLGNHYHSKVE